MAHGTKKRPRHPKARPPAGATGRRAASPGPPVAPLPAMATGTGTAAGAVPHPPGARLPSLAAHPIVTTAWGWRIGAVAVLVAFGLCFTFLLDGKAVFGALWAVVTLAWGFFVVKLQRRHEEHVRTLRARR